MVNSLRKGSVWRTTVRQWLDGWGWATHARPLGEAGDDIDASGYSLSLSVEAKNHARIELAAFVDQAERQAGPNQVPVVLLKRKGRATAEDAYVVLSGRAFRRMIEKD